MDRKSRAPPFHLQCMIWAMMIVWRIREEIIRSVCAVLWTVIRTHTWAVLKSWVLVFGFRFSFLGQLLRVNLITSEGKNVRPSVRPSTKSFSDFNEIWYVHRGRWLTHDGMLVTRSKVKVKVMGLLNFQKLHFSNYVSSAIYNGSWQVATNS